MSKGSYDYISNMPIYFFNRDLNVRSNNFSLGKISYNVTLIKIIFNLHSVRPKESPLLQQLRTDLKDKRMIVSKDQLHLSSVVGHGKKEQFHDYGYCMLHVCILRLHVTKSDRYIVILIFVQNPCTLRRRVWIGLQGIY